MHCKHQITFQALPFAKCHNVQYTLVFQKDPLFHPLTPTVVIWVQPAIKHPVPDRTRLSCHL